MCGLVDLVSNVSPHAQVTMAFSYFGCIPAFICFFTSLTKLAEPQPIVAQVSQPDKVSAYFK